MSILPQKTALGRLEIVEVYDDYEGPKFFLAKNQFKQYFVCYWVDHRKVDDAIGWLYLQISENRLNRLRRAQISINEAFVKAEQGLYLVYTPADQSHDTAEYRELSELDKDLLPPPDLFVEPRNVVVLDNADENWIYELSIFTGSGGRSPSTLAVSQVFRAFQSIIDSLMKRRADSQSEFTFPLNASYGSFKVKFGATSNDIAMSALASVVKVLNSGSEDISEASRRESLDPHDVKELLDVIRQNKLRVTISPKIYNEIESDTLIVAANLQERIVALEESTHSIIPSIKIPQANDLEKVIRAVEIVDRGEELAPSSFGGEADGINSNRQVRYYVDAAFTLDLLTRDGELTSAGRFFLSKETSVQRYQVLADRFESSEFGWAWIRWAKVKSMVDLDGATAVDFVMASVPTLGEATAKRRATTLEKWLEKLKPYHRAYAK